MHMDLCAAESVAPDWCLALKLKLRSVSNLLRAGCGPATVTCIARPREPISRLPLEPLKLEWSPMHLDLPDTQERFSLLGQARPM
jgi:hypothetical protein